MLIVFEGVDSSGKETHSRLAYERLVRDGFSAQKVSFPNYGSKAAGALKMYLDGEFGAHPEDVNPYVASTFYAVDRFASFRQVWRKSYESGITIISDRYTTSNMIHQGAKFNHDNELDEYLGWLSDLEYGKFGLPTPDKVIFLDMPMEFRIKLLNSRGEKIEGRNEKDIHERDIEYLKQAHLCAQKLARRYGWERLSVVKDDNLRLIEDVHNEVYGIVRRSLEHSVENGRD